MIEDMNARKLGPHSQRSHIYCAPSHGRQLEQILAALISWRFDQDARGFEYPLMAHLLRVLAARKRCPEVSGRCGSPLLGFSTQTGAVGKLPPRCAI
jgi:hypothetical protein